MEYVSISLSPKPAPGAFPPSGHKRPKNMTMANTTMANLFGHKPANLTSVRFLTSFLVLLILCLINNINIAIFAAETASGPMLRTPVGLVTPVTPSTGQDQPSISLPGPGEITVNGMKMASLQHAFDFVPAGGFVLLGAGIFPMSGVLKTDGVTLIGSRGTGTGENGEKIAGTWLDGVAADGKAAITIKATDVTIDRINCRNIAVKSRNGACVRHEGGRLTIRNVHFKDSEQGILTWNRSEYLLVEDSIFENLGRAGRAHALYVSGDQLVVRRNRIIRSKDQGHEIKARTKRTVITRNVIASLDGNDSRLIDISSGGETVITDNLLVEGSKTVNWQLLAFAVEGKSHPNSALTVTGNIIITDRLGGSEFILIGDQDAPLTIERNIIIGKMWFQKEKTDWPEGNYFYENRKIFGLPPAPALPDFNFR